MSTLNVMAREVAAKLVFYGPGLSGKTTSLKCIHASVKPSLRGELMSLPTEADRTLFFDFLPVRVERVGEYALRLALYTVPGQVFYNATRKLVLQGADGVVFVADSNPGADESNRESMANLEDNLAEQGVRLDGFPLVIAYNKRDLPSAAPVAAMRAALNPRGVPDFETSATSGRGVLDAMKAMIRLVIRDLRARRVVPMPKSAATPSPEVMPLARDERGSLEAQVQEHLAAAPEAQRLGAVASLAPAALIDQARVAEAAFAAGDWDGCVRTCAEAVERGLAFAGAGPLASQASALGLDGRDLLGLQTRLARGGARVDDAAFALYVLAQGLVRLTQAGLPSPQH